MEWSGFLTSLVLAVSHHLTASAKVTEMQVVYYKYQTGKTISFTEVTINCINFLHTYYFLMLSVNVTLQSIERMNNKIWTFQVTSTVESLQNYTLLNK